MAGQFNGRAFLCRSPSTNSVSWETYIKDFPETVGKAFYAKVTICWGGKLVGIHSYSEDGELGYKNFVDKLSKLSDALLRYEMLIETDSTGRGLIDLNQDVNNHFSGTVFYHRARTPSTGELLSILEFASCKEKIRIHSGEDENSMLKSLAVFRKELNNLAGCCVDTHANYLKLKEQSK